MRMKCAIMRPLPDWPLPHYSEVEERLSTSVWHGLKKRKVEASSSPIAAMIERTFSYVADMFADGIPSSAEVVILSETADAAEFTLTYAPLTITTFVVDDEVGQEIERLYCYTAFISHDPALFWTEDSLAALMHSRVTLEDIQQFTLANAYDENACAKQANRLAALYRSKLKALLSSGWR